MLIKFRSIFALNRAYIILFVFITLCFTGNSYSASPPSSIKPGEWVDLPEGSLHSKTPVKVMIMPDDAPDIDMNRWVRAFRNKDYGLFIDRQTVQKQQLYVSDAYQHKPPVQYTFWMRLMIYKGTTRAITNPNQHMVDCQTGLIDGLQIEPESPEENMFNFFCKSRDALTTAPLINPIEAQRAEAAARYSQIQNNAINQQISDAERVKSTYMHMSLINGLSTVLSTIHH